MTLTKKQLEQRLQDISDELIDAELIDDRQRHQDLLEEQCQTPLQALRHGAAVAAVRRLQAPWKLAAGARGARRYGGSCGRFAPGARFRKLAR